ncbi:MAG: hypothetical protein WD845_17445 [Pirellulales bacterium]
MMDPWEAALWIVAVYVAVVALVRMMALHRQRLVLRLLTEKRAERRRLAQTMMVRKRRAAAARQSMSGPRGVR